MNSSKQARRDAREYARAQMFYGEGAGTRRKLIQATVEGKARRDPAYGRAFNRALEEEDMAEHAAKARRERRVKDSSSSINRNVRGLATGNPQSVNTGVLVAISAVVIAHRSGLDKKIYAAAKEGYRDLKARFVANKKVKNFVHNITTLRD